MPSIPTPGIPSNLSTPTSRSSLHLLQQQRQQGDQPKWDAEGIARTVSNVMIMAGVITCLGLAVAAVGDVDSESTVVFLLLVPTFFGGGCLLTLVNISWMSRRPGKRCSLIQLACNLVLIMMTLYVELLFWSYRKKIALAILCGAALPMLIFINMPSAFMVRQHDGDAATGEADTVVMDDDEHSLFMDVECPPSNHIRTTSSTQQQERHQQQQQQQRQQQPQPVGEEEEENDRESPNEADTPTTTAESNSNASPPQPPHIETNLDTQHEHQPPVRDNNSAAVPDSGDQDVENSHKEPSKEEDDEHYRSV